jgi:carboxypeptidase Taq
LVITSVEGTYLSDLDAGSGAVAESQSKIWENVVWRSRGFGGGLSQAEGYGSCQFADVESKPFYRAVNTVDLRQFIRIKADEATYNLILYCASNWNSNYYRKL